MSSLEVTGIQCYPGAGKKQNIDTDISMKQEKRALEQCLDAVCMTVSLECSVFHNVCWLF